MNPIQKIIEEQRKQSEIHKLSEETINRKLAAREVVQRPEWKEKRGEANRKRVWTDESKQKVADLHTGRKRSDDTRENISKGRTGIIFSEQHLANMSIAQLGSTHTEKTCKLISDQMYDPKRQARMRESRQDPKNFSTCPHCSKYMIKFKFASHVENCLFLKGPITTYFNDIPQFVYYTEESLVQAGYSIEAIKLVIDTNKKHKKMLFVRDSIT